MASGFEHRRIDLDSKRQRGNRAHARDGDQTLADLAGFVRGVQFGVEVFDTGVDLVDLLTQKDEHLPGLRRYGGLLFNSREQRHDFSGSLTSDDAELGGVTAHCVDQSGALTDQGLTHLQDYALSLLVATGEAPAISAPTNTDAHRIAEGVRAERRALGMLGPDLRVVRATGSERDYALRLARGDPGPAV